MKITILGAGRWGSTLAWLYDKYDREVTLWDRSPSRIKSLEENGGNDYVKLPSSIKMTTNLCKALDDTDVIFIVIAATGFIDLCQKLRGKLEGKQVILCMKGLEQETGRRLSEMARSELGDKFMMGVFLGPAQPQDLVQDQPTAMVVSSDDPSVLATLQQTCDTPLVRAASNVDLIGVEVGASSKNVIAIGSGILEGMKWGGVRGFLISRGAQEVANLIEAMGGNRETAYGLTHLGDYAATAFHPHSKNFLKVYELITGEPVDGIAEGVATASALKHLWIKYKISMPICEMVLNCLEGEPAQEQVISLFDVAFDDVSG